MRTFLLICGSWYHKNYAGDFFCSSVFISVCVFNVWPRDTKRLDTPGLEFLVLPSVPSVLKFLFLFLPTAPAIQWTLPIWKLLRWWRTSWTDPLMILYLSLISSCTPPGFLGNALSYKAIYWSLCSCFSYLLIFLTSKCFLPKLCFYKHNCLNYAFIAYFVISWL